jgi:hypothetical protein
VNTTAIAATEINQSILRELTADEIAIIGAAGGVDEFPAIPR